MMFFDPKTRANQSTPAPGLVELTDEQFQVYLAHNGFVKVTVGEGEQAGKALEVTPDTEAWEAWKAASPEPEPAPPTMEERLSALESATLALMMGEMNDV